MAKQIEKPKRKDMLTLFILFFPTVLVAMMPRIPIMAFDMSIVIKTLLCFYQFVIIKNFVDDYYEK